MATALYIEFAARSLCHHGEKICGDNYIIRRSASANRTLAVLSDGLGHGVRANILSNLTAIMLANFVEARTSAPRIAAMLEGMLPVDSRTNSSYATFTLIDIDNLTGGTILMLYDNPPPTLIRAGAVMPIEWSEPYGRALQGGRPGKLVTASFSARRGDRLVSVSDGVTQSGQASGTYGFGWGGERLGQYCSYLVDSNPAVSSADLAGLVLSKAGDNDGNRPSDDMSCAVVTFRPPRRLMLASCPPAMASDNGAMAAEVVGFEGEKVVCGEPVARIIATYQGEKLVYDESSHTRASYPVYRLPGFDIVTDGVIVPGKVLEILERGDGYSPGDDIPSRIARMLLRNDTISFRIGMRRNTDPMGRLPDEFSLRRNILRRIMELLEKKYEKMVDAVYF